ncbi:hypothetical protein EFBL_2694 [Effusibacillus lacus]|uniref:DUF4083 domain-containing protein n=2 Tax=Effusibacillus lacus TaxID=1348429 RepID=A0A292YRK4_9BACL|nr:hypothetical protein EFBL_2694 [Effusibacillus lacus]
MMLLWLLPLALIVILVYFLFRAIDFMRTKTRHDEMILEKLQRLIELQEKRDN